MKKNILKTAGLIIAAAVLFGFAGCKTGVKTHVHTFSEEWSSDETYHWHAATCEHEDQVKGKVEHDWDEGVVSKVPTVSEEGVATYECKICKKIKTEAIEKLPAPSYNWYESPVDADTGLAATKSSTYVLFGVFPKTIKASDVTVDETDRVIMGANTYYKGSDGEYYAKVTAKPHESSYKYSNGITITEGTEYYFKVEPIKWKVLTENYNSSKNALLLAEDILTANVPFYEDKDHYRSIDGDGAYTNNYKHSQIRAYLNGLTYQGQSSIVTKWNGKGLLQTAFTSVAQSKIKTSTVNNSEYSTQDRNYNLPMATKHTCENTNDKIFLLSEWEATTTSYGFSTYNSSGTTSNRIRLTTDYAKANYAYQSETEGCGGYWWLRTPHCDYANGARAVSYTGSTHIYVGNVTTTKAGIVPALCISLE